MSKKPVRLSGLNQIALYNAKEGDIIKCTKRDKVSPFNVMVGIVLAAKRLKVKVTQHAVNKDLCEVKIIKAINKDRYYV